MADFGLLGGIALTDIIQYEAERNKPQKKAAKKPPPKKAVR
jgi:hypothetical protein